MNRTLNMTITRSKNEKNDEHCTDTAGNVDAAYTYDAFGKTISATGGTTPSRAAGSRKTRSALAAASTCTPSAGTTRWKLRGQALQGASLLMDG